MIRLALGALAAAAALPALAQEGGPIRSGEHDGFTRVVMIIEPTTEWSLETAPGEAVIFFPGRRLDFGTGEAFDRIGRTRVTAIQPAIEAGGTRVRVGVGCDCRITASFVGARHLALDVGDRGVARAAVAPAPEPAGEDAAARAEREALALVSAEAALIAQIARAADQGVVRLAPQGPQAPAETAALAEPTRASPPRPLPRPVAAASGPAPAGDAETVAELALLEQIEAISVYDRDSAALAARRPPPPPPEVCVADDVLDVAAWSADAPLHAQTPALMRTVVGEFDRPDPEALRALARLYVRFGFGAEAEALIAGFADVDTPDGALIADLGRAVEGREASADGKLALDVPCPGRHGLWLALGGRAPAFHDAAHFETVQAALAELPPDLRALVAPALALRLVEAGRPAEAALVHAVAVRAGGTPGAALTLAAARIDAAEGRTDAALAALRGLAESNDPAAVDALIALARIALDAGVALPERIVADLAGAALALRGDPREAALRGLEVEALAAGGALPSALRATRGAMADLPAARERLAARMVAGMAAADADRVGAGPFAETAIAAADLFPLGPSGDPARRAVAARLTAIGLPNAGLAFLAPAVARDDGEARRLAARAYLGLGSFGAALAVLEGLDGPETLGLRAEALARSGDAAGAVALLAGAGAEAEAAAYVWPSGDWARARAAAGEDAGRAAMAGYMATRGGPPARPGSVDPEVLTAESAFQAPLPALDAPSLGAARDLLATGGHVGVFVGSVIDEE